MMIPPMKNEIDTEATETARDSSSACGSAALGNATNRPPVRRRLFDAGPTDSAPGSWVRQKLSDLIAADRERGLQKYGFDFKTDTPSTSSAYTYTTVNPSEVPSFYTRVRGCNALATFSPKKDRSIISLVPIILPADIKSTPSTSGAEPKKEIESEIAPSPKSLPNIISPKEVDATPFKPKGKKKAASKNEGISGQMLMTSYYPKKRSAAAIDSTPMEKKKRASNGSNNAAQGEMSNVIRP